MASSAASFASRVPSMRAYRAAAGVSGLASPARTAMAMATGVWMANTFSLLRAPRRSPPRSRTHISSQTRRMCARMPTKASPSR